MNSGGFFRNEMYKCMFQSTLTKEFEQSFGGVGWCYSTIFFHKDEYR